MLSGKKSLLRPATTLRSRQFSLQVKTSTLKNGVRVVSVPKPETSAASLGLFVGQAGPRGEQASTVGSAQYLRRLGYKGTTNLDKDTRNLVFEANGAEFEVDVSREYLLYQVAAPGNSLGNVTKPFAESLNPKFEEYLVEDEHSNVELESAPYEFELSEKLHQVGFRHQGLGNPLYLPPSQYHKLDVDLIKFHWAKYFRQRNLSVVGVGVEHGALENLVASQFEALDWEPESTHKSKYVGGEGLYVYDGAPTLAIGFEAPSISSNDRAAALVVQALFNGSNVPTPQVYSQGRTYVKAVSASRLTNAFGNKASVGANYSAYSDSGLFYVHATYSKASEGASVASTLASEIKAVAQGKFSVEELAAAKTSARLAVNQALETRSGLVRFLGEQSLFGSSSATPEQFTQKVQDVTAEDVKRVVSAFLKSNPTVVGLGDVASGLPTFSELKELLK